MVAITQATTTVGLIDRQWEQAQEPARGHLGASQIGSECSRSIWYSYRWALQPNFSGRILRLFRFGHEIEKTLHEYLRSANVQTYQADPATGKQFNFNAIGGHFSGSCDGMADGLHESPGTRHLLEFKTSSDKYFKQMKKEGVEKAKLEHFAQMQVYMHFFGLKRAFYLVLNKNNHELYSERVKYEKAIAEQYIDRARMIIESVNPPIKINEDPTWYKCQWCDYKNICHFEDLPEVNCRTCLHSSPITTGEGAQWHCNFYERDGIPIEFQRKGCENHLFIPALLPFQCVGADTENNLVEYESKNGHRFFNGKKDEDVYTSEELRSFDPDIFDNENVKKAVDLFGQMTVIKKEKIND